MKLPPKGFPFGGLLSALVLVLILVVVLALILILVLILSFVFVLVVHDLTSKYSLGFPRCIIPRRL